MFNLCARTVQFRRYDCSIWAVALFNSKRSGCSTLAEYSFCRLRSYIEKTLPCDKQLPAIAYAFPLVRPGILIVVRIFQYRQFPNLCPDISLQTMHPQLLTLPFCRLLWHTSVSLPRSHRQYCTYSLFCRLYTHKNARRNAYFSEHLCVAMEK